MAVFLLQIGQCGLQVGQKIHPHLRVPPHLILMDTQPKVIKDILQQDPLVKKENCMYFQYGRGNNWAIGYSDTVRPKGIAPTTGHLRMLQENSKAIEFAMENIRKEVEKSQIFIGIDLLLSSAGGTGSGLGSRLSQQIKDQLDCQVVGHVVLPSQSGETTLQFYNSCLCLSTLMESCDALVVNVNEWYGQKNIPEINQTIGEQKAALLNSWQSNDVSHFQMLLQCSAGPLKFNRVQLTSKPLKNTDRALLMHKTIPLAKDSFLSIQNGLLIPDYLALMAERTQAKLQSMAFLHWYDEWNMKERLESSVLKMQEVVDLYKSVSR